MTDKDITERIATGVMGWVRHSIKTDYWVLPRIADKVDLMRWDVMADNNMRPFSPLTSHADCMMAWDKFSAGWCVIITNEPTAGNEYTISVYDPRWDDEQHVKVINPDRRRAMCLTMYKATERSEG